MEMQKIHKIFGILASKKAKIFVLTSIFVLVGVFMVVQPAFADLDDVVRFMLGHIAELIVFITGQLIALITFVLIAVANYNSFTDSPAVGMGWVIVRDIANMFFVVVFLVIAFGTILGVDQYHYKKTLPRLLLMAILINFSKTIAGLVIDFGQVIMLTFVNAFTQAAGGNFLEVLRVRDIWSVQRAEVGSIPVTELVDVVGGLILACLVSIVSLVVITIMTMVLVFRMVMLWLLVVISPIAFLSAAVPSSAISGYYERWWKEFTNYVIVGPVLAFFIWLSLAVVSAPAGNNLDSVGEGIAKDPRVSSEETTIRATAAGIGDESSMIKYLIGLGMLVGGLMMTQQIGVAGSGMAGGAISWAKSKGTGALKKAQGYAWKGTRWTGKKITGGAYGAAEAGTRSLREKAYSGLAKAGIPLASTLAVSRLGKLRKKRQDTESKQAETIKSLSFEEARGYLQREKGKTLQTETTKARVSQLSRKFLSGINTKNYTDPKNRELADSIMSDVEKRAQETGDETHLHTIASFYEKMLKGFQFEDASDENKEVFNEVSKKLETAANKISDPKIKGEHLKQREAIKQARPDMLEPGEEISKTLGGLSALKLGSTVNAKAFDDTRVLEYFHGDKKMWDSIYKSTGQAQRGKMDAFAKSRTPSQVATDLKADRISVDSIDASRLEADNGALAGQIAEHGSAKLKEDVQKKHGKEYLAGLEASRSKNLGTDPENERYNDTKMATSTEMLRSGAGVGKSFNANKDGNFSDDVDRVSFNTAVREDPTSLLGLKHEDIKGEVAQQARRLTSNKKVLRKMAESAKTNDQKDTFKKIVQQVYNKAGQEGNEDMLQFIEGTGSTRGQIKGIQVEVRKKAEKAGIQAARRDAEKSAKKAQEAVAKAKEAEMEEFTKSIDETIEKHEETEKEKEESEGWKK